MIRNITAQDAERCAEIYGYYVKNTCFSLEETAPTATEYAARIAEVLSKGYPFLGADNADGTLAGFAYLNTYNARSAYKITADLSVYVDKAALHEHLGGALLAAIEAEAKKRGIKNIVSIVTDENENSKFFHEKHGFVLEGHIKNVAEKFGKTLGVYYFRKAL